MKNDEIVSFYDKDNNYSFVHKHGFLLAVVEKHFIKLDYIVVKSKKQRRGVGTMLLLELDKLASDCQKSIYGLLFDDELIDFYVKSGYNILSDSYNTNHKKIFKHLSEIKLQDRHYSVPIAEYN